MNAQSQELSIRPATEDDLPGLLELYRQLESDQSRLSLENLRAAFEQMRRYPDHHIHVAERDGRILGTFTLMIMDAAGHRCSPVAIVEDVVVDQAARRRGIGRLMMEFTMERSRLAGCYKLMLSSNLKRQDAHQFYESLRFERHGYSYSMFL